MAILNVYTVRDQKVGFSGLTMEKNDAVAIRNFGYSVNNAETLINFSPVDFALYCVGKFDTDSGKIDAFAVPELVVEASSLIGG
jgi:hypothetical protein